jgi:hypothetical protein
MPDDLLTRMSTTGYGPVTLTDAGDGVFGARVAGREVKVMSDGQALRFRTSVGVPWPAGGGGEPSHDPIAVALEELAHTHRPELVTIDGAPGTELEISMWIPVEDATPARVAGAVYATARIATLALATVTDHALLLEVTRAEPPAPPSPPTR